MKNFAVWAGLMALTVFLGLQAEGKWANSSSQGSGVQTSVGLERVIVDLESSRGSWEQAFVDENCLRRGGTIQTCEHMDPIGALGALKIDGETVAIVSNWMGLIAECQELPRHACEELLAQNIEYLDYVSAEKRKTQGLAELGLTEDGRLVILNGDDLKAYCQEMGLDDYTCSQKLVMAPVQ